ncbi:MAG: chromosome segregation protein SMC [Clostridia bacterium]|nr:chromosome segregation protein SMC [Clostridia bacterium]
MYLKALEMRGFKSFPDKTRLDFEKGITAIVGPNGSGKSNISDAVRWVLGEMSAKTLRGSKMEDVVFAGTAKRSQTGFCEVSIIIDNSENELPEDAKEVKITRKYFRSVESEYRINDRPSRLKDIYELFLNTGIGREGYSVIGQGKISEVLSQKSDERRHIFEEAAGISKFRYRKNDAEKKLIETDTNLVRLTDIVSEISTRLTPLEKEAENAKIYLELAGRKKELEVSLWVDKLSKFHSETDALEKDYTEAKENYSAKQRELELLDSSIDGLFNKKQFLNAKAESVRGELSLLEEERNRLENARSLATNDISHHNEKKSGIAGEISFLSTSETEKLQSDIEEAQKTVEEKKKLLESAEKELEKASEEAEKLGKEFADAEKLLQEKVDEIRVENEKLTELRISEAEKLNFEKSEAQRKEFLNSEIEKAKAELEQAQNYLKAAQKRKKEAQEEKTSILADIEEEKKELDKLTDKKAEYAALKNDYAAQYASALHRKETLEKTEAMLEGYPNSVKAVLNSKELPGICGPVSKIFSVPEEYVTAIETALGAAVSNIVVEDEECAKKAIAFLKDSNAGRATFLPLTSISGKSVSDNVSASFGFCGIASSVIGYDKKYEKVAEYLLGRTIICDNIDNASKTAGKFSYKYKTVTLDGQVINAGGSYTGGSSSKTGILSRSSDIANLEKLIAKTLKDAKALNGKIAENASDIASSEEYIESLKNDLLNADASFYKSESDIDLQNEHIETCSSRLKNMKERLLESEADKIKEHLAEIKAQRQKSEELVSSLEEEKKVLDANADELYLKLGEATEKKSQIQINLVAARKDAESASAAIKTANQRKEQNEERIASLKKELEEIDSRLSGIAFDIENNEKETEKIKLTVEEKKKALNDYIEEASSLEAQSTVKRESQKDLIRDKEVFFEIMTKLESKLEKARNEYDTLTSKLFEEYSLSFSEALSLNFPPPEKSSERELSSIRSKIKALGNINVNAVEEYAETKKRYDFMQGQITDLQDAKKSLENIIRRLENDMKKMFSEAIVKINASFKEVFSELFGGGNADIVISDPENMLESGIEINIQPPGKTVKNISLLSGGEQAFTAIALYFAILKVNPAPFYVFDEIEAALDDINVNRFAAYLKKNSDTQFIIITHRRGTMEISDTMYGVTMQEKGVSTFLKVNLDDVEKKTGVEL